MNRGVARSSELLRVAALPRRDWTENADELVDLLTEELKLPGGSMTLWREQAVALAECYDCGGLFAPIAVGKGKALVSLLAPVLLRAERPVLCVPAQLREQTNLRVLPEMSKHWRLNPNLVVVGYSELSLAHRCDMLNELRPDVLILDEAHAVKNDKAARTKRLRRYLAENPETRVVALSGTMTRKSLRDYWRLLLWSLGEQNAPIPRHWRDLQDWADALDEDVDARARLAPGALRVLCDPEEDIRSGYRRRLVETPGVVASSLDELGTSLRISSVDLKLPLAVRDALSDLRSRWETPNGDPITEAVDLWRHARELALGFWYRWEPAPPKEWLKARREWKLYVRETLRHNRRGLDSELQVWNECDRAESPPTVWKEWKAIRDSFRPNTVAEWISEFAVDNARGWLEDELGLCWTEHVEFGKRLAEVSGFPYYGGGKKAAEKLLDEHGPAILSVAAHCEGKNLQHYSRNLVVSPPSSGKRWEQLLGRTHRPGQQADEVAVEVYQYTEEQRTSFLRAKSEALYIQDTIGARQKLLYADYLREG